MKIDIPAVARELGKACQQNRSRYAFTTRRGLNGAIVAIVVRRSWLSPVHLSVRIFRLDPAAVAEIGAVRFLDAKVGAQLLNDPVGFAGADVLFDGGMTGVWLSPDTERDIWDDVLAIA
jgi:hypothetical protein